MGKADSRLQVKAVSDPIRAEELCSRAAMQCLWTRRTIFDPGECHGNSNPHVPHPSRRMTRLSSGATAVRSGTSLTAATLPRALSLPCTTAPEAGSSTWAAAQAFRSVNWSRPCIASWISITGSTRKNHPAFPGGSWTYPWPRRINYRPETSLAGWLANNLGLVCETPG